MIFEVFKCPATGAMLEVQGLVKENIEHWYLVAQGEIQSIQDYYYLNLLVDQNRRIGQIGKVERARDLLRSQV